MRACAGSGDLCARRRILSAAFLTVAIALALPNHACAEVLAPLRWEHRVLIGALDAQEASRARVTLETHAAGLAERALIWFLVSDTAVTSNSGETIDADALRSLAETQFPNGRQGFVLVGLDGRMKARLETLDVTALFEIIDRMPMRRRELRSGRSAVSERGIQAP